MYWERGQRGESTEKGDQIERERERERERRERNGTGLGGQKKWYWVI